MRSKRYQKITSKIDKNKAYTLDQALDFIISNSKAKFDETIEAHVQLGIDPKKTEQQVRGTAVLPHGVVKNKIVAAFVSSANIKQAEKAGADLVGGEDLIEKIKKSGKCNFDIAIAEPDLMKSLTQIARILGPKGLMPSPKYETVTTEIKKTIQELKKGKTVFKNDAGGNLHQPIGKVSWTKDKIEDNFNTFLAAVKKVKPPKTKGAFIRNVFLASTMGPALKVQL